MPKKNELSKAIVAALTATYGVAAVAQGEPGEPGESMEEIVVVGIRGSLSRAADLKRDANKIQDSIVAEDIGKFPDQNVAESLQRITGVSISRNAGQGNQITVRSFGPEFNVVKLNDRTLATTTGGRSYNFQVLPSELIGGADVIKSPTADLSAGSIGAYINVRTPRPLDNPGFRSAIAAKGNYQNLAEDTNPEFNGLISNTFADDTIGVMVGAAFRETDNRIDNYRASIWNEFSPAGAFGFPIPGVVGEDGQPLLDAEGEPTNPDLPGARGPGRTIFTMNDENRERTGATAVFQWEPSGNVSHTVDFLYTKLDVDRLGSGPQVPMQIEGNWTRAVIGDAGTLLEATIENTDVEVNVDAAFSEDETSAFGYNGVFTQGALTLEVDAAYSKAEGDFEGDNTTALHYSMFNEDGDIVPSEIHLDYSTDVPSLRLTGPNGQGPGGLDLTDPSKVRAAWQRFAASDVEDEVTELKLDALYEIDAGVVQSVKVGVAYEDRDFVFNEFANSVDFNGSEAFPFIPGPLFVGNASTGGDPSSVGELPDSLFSLGDSNFMDGNSGNFPRQWVQLTDFAGFRQAAQEAIEAVRPDDPFVQAGWDTVRRNVAGSYDINDERTSAYFMVNLEGNFWSGNLGLRYVDISTKGASHASLIQELQLADITPTMIINQAVSEGLAPNSSNTSEDHFLPSLNFKFDLADGHILRTAASQTIARPNVADMRPAQSETPGVNSSIVTITGGNPDLKSVEVTAFDLSYEFYADDNSAFSAAYFYKDISNFISTFNQVGLWDGPIQQELADALAERGEVIQFQSNRNNNRDGGTVQGLELAGLYHFAGVLDGFGVQANYTYTDSEDDDAEPVNLPLVPEPGSVLEGFAENSYNLIAFYDKGRLQARAAFNWRDRFLSNRSGDADQPEFTEDFGQLDLSALYGINDNLTVFFEAINLTDEDRIAFLGQRDRVSLVEKTGRRFQAGVRATF